MVGRVAIGREAAVTSRGDPVDGAVSARGVGDEQATATPSTSNVAIRGTALSGFFTVVPPGVTRSILVRIRLDDTP
jgi:hypothetical protein